MNGSLDIRIDDVMFQLQEEHDFGWLAKLGHVFEVFAQQDSGNISFGIEKNSERFFIKYAGAKSTAFSGDPQDAINNFKNAMPLYREISHPSLIKLIDHYEVGSGYAAVFEWFDGESLHPHWSFPPPAKYNDPNSPFYRYKQLSVAQRLISLDHIYSFHKFVDKKDFVAIDFYDGSLPKQNGSRVVLKSVPQQFSRGVIWTIGKRSFTTRIKISIKNLMNKLMLFSIGQRR